jgi:Asp/Glu/hydantoin racemase
MNLLDDMLSVDLAEAGSLNETMIHRMVSLARYAKVCGAMGILFTCSAFGPAIERAKRIVELPTLKPNEAMFDEALSICSQLGRPGRIGLLTTFAPAALSMTEELYESAKVRGLRICVESVCAAQAMSALNEGDIGLHDKLVVESAKKLPRCDVVLLGQFSMARVKPLVEPTLQIPTLTSPESAVRRLMADLT